MRKNLKKNYSIKKKLRLENKIDEDFEMRLNNLTLEDIIALKLELSSKNYKGKFYGLQLYKYIQDIARDAVVKFAIAARLDLGRGSRRCRGDGCHPLVRGGGVRWIRRR